MKKALLLALLLSCVACSSTSSNWEPDTVYTETSTYDQGDHFYQEVGVSGELGDGVRMDLFGVANPSTKGDRDNYFGGGVRFEFRIGDK